MKPLRILIASTTPPGEVGGLAHFQLQFGEQLRRHSTATVSFFNPSVCDIPRWKSLASRPLLHPLLDQFIQARYFADPTFPTGSFDVVHFVGTGWDFLGFAMQAFARKINARFTIHPAVHPDIWGDDELDLRLYRRADAVFCQSQSEIDHLAALGLDSKKAVLIGLPPMCREDGEADRIRIRLGIGDRPVVFFLGRRTAGKGYTMLLDAWKQVIQAVPSAVLILGGPGGNEHESLLRALPEDSYRDLGILSVEEKADVYAACDIFCMPSAEESFGIVFVEAWSYGKPVICGPAPASRELVTDGENGMHCDQCPEAIGKALVSLLKDRPKAAALGAAGQRLQKERFTWDIITEIHLGVYAGPSTNAAVASAR